MSKNEPVVLVPYDQSWVEKFEREKELLTSVIGSSASGGIHHIGSTSIPGISAKPIIDILVGVDSLESSRPCIELLSKFDYQYFPYKADSEHWFCKPSPERRTHHLHLIPTTHPDFKARIAFRNYLRENKEYRDLYQTLKTKLADQYRDDREAYTQAKASFVKDVVSKALRKNP